VGREIILTNKKKLFNNKMKKNEHKSKNKNDHHVKKKLFTTKISSYNGPDGPQSTRRSYT